MAKVLVLYYSAYGHIETMANAVAEGAREAGAQVDIKRVPDLVPEDVARRSHYKLDQPAPIAKIDDLRRNLGGSCATIGRGPMSPSKSLGRRHRFQSIDGVRGVEPDPCARSRKFSRRIGSAPARRPPMA